MDNMVMDHNHNHNSGNESMECDMQMNFHFGYCETILWKSLTVKSASEFLGSAAFIFFLAFMYEGLKYFREKLYYNVVQSEIVANAKHTGQNGTNNCCSNTMLSRQQKSLRQKMLNRAHLIQTLMHVIQVTISYLLMLIVMTFNYGLCFAIILGAAVGYFCFGWIRQQSVDFNEHCH